jgi:hypothetical protein
MYSDLFEVIRKAPAQANAPGTRAEGLITTSKTLNRPAQESGQFTPEQRRRFYQEDGPPELQDRALGCGSR